MRKIVMIMMAGLMSAVAGHVYAQAALPQWAIALCDENPDVIDSVQRYSQDLEETRKDEVRCTKVLENGMLYLMYQGKKYTIQGQEVR